jgi:hypothetical protein
MKNMISDIYKGFFAIFLHMKNYDLKHIQRVFLMEKMAQIFQISKNLFSPKLSFLKKS